MVSYLNSLWAFASTVSNPFLSMSHHAHTHLHTHIQLHHHPCISFIMSNGNVHNGSALEAEYTPKNILVTGGAGFM